MQDTKRIWVWVGVAVVVIAVIFAFVWRPSAKAPVVATPPPATYAPQGQLVPNFPKQLILSSLTIIKSSYEIDYSSSTTQYTAVVDSTSSMSSVYVNYIKYLATNKYAIENEIKNQSSSRGIYAVSTSSVVSIAIMASSTGAEAIITYDTK